MSAKSLSSPISETIRTCLAGSAFGAALTIAQVYLPDVIINQMRMKDFHMLEVFLTATSLSAIVLVIREKFSKAKPITRSNSRLALSSTNISSYDGNILGGALIGAGMATSGACPGTVIIQLAQGVPSARTTILGAIIGGTLWSMFGNRIVHDDQTPSNPGSKPNNVTQSTAGQTTSSHSNVNDNTKTHQTTRFTISQALNTNPTKTLLTFLLLTSSTVLFSRIWLPGKSHVQTSTVISGALVAAAQAISLFLTSIPLGTSKAYEEIGQYLTHHFFQSGQNSPKIGKDSKQLSATPQKPSILKMRNVIFALGMASGSLAISYLPLILPVKGSSLFNQAARPQGSISVLQSLLGGVCLSFGARMAGGCTSGHGISGLSALSFASLISVMSMFGAGIGVRLAMDFVGI